MTTTNSKLDVSFVLPIAPMPTPRPRARAIVVRGRAMATFYSPKEYKDWQAEALKALKRIGDEAVRMAPSLPYSGPVAVDLIVQAARPKTTKLPHPKPDVDNYAKAVLDVLTQDGRFWSDDSQVQVLTVSKRWSDTVGIAVSIREL